MAEKRMKKGMVVIMPSGPNMVESLGLLLEEYQVKRVYMIVNEKHSEYVEEFSEHVRRKGIDLASVRLGENIWEDMISRTRDIVDSYEPDKEPLIMFTDTGDSDMKTMSTVAAFTASIRALSKDDKGRLKMLPFLTLEYKTALTDKKLKILKVMEDDMDCCKSFDELSKRTGMSLPLISYHVNGNLKSEGLKDLGLVETDDYKGRISVRLSTQGKLLLKSYLRTYDEESGKIMIKSPAMLG